MKKNTLGEIMIKKLLIYESTGFDPYLNIATEKYLLDTVLPDSCILYLWQNANTVVIGRNQNAWAECRIRLLEQEGGKLARRLSGGGAVYHDLGNLNFTFLTTDEDHNVDKQLSVVQTACRACGISTEKSGRNDLLAEGKKFSGNAFYHSRGKAYHHGTLLVSADMEKLSRYLTPPKAKLEAKGVQSVRSRVTNLQSLSPSLTCHTLKQHMAKAFCEVYGMDATILQPDKAALARIAEEAASLSGWDWLYGNKLPFSFSCNQYFPWGHLQLQLQVESGTIQDVAAYSDAMDWRLPEQIRNALQNCRFSGDPMLQALINVFGESNICKDIFQMLADQVLC